MIRAMIAALALMAPTVASADFSDDMRKIWIDDRARFYLVACPDGENGELRGLLDKYGSHIFREGDASDEASDWNTRYRWEPARAKDDQECANLRDMLRNTIYAPAIVNP